MKDWIPRIIILAVLAIVLGVPFLLRPADPEATGSSHAAGPESGGGAGGRLVILTPHNEQIRFEFSRAFNQWRREQNLPPVEFDWRASGGTSDLRKQVMSELEKAAREGREEQGIGYDLFFGGGDFEHNTLARGITIQRGGEDVNLPALIPVRLPDGLLEEAFPEPTIGGVPLYHPDRYWVGVVLSSFGIVYNRDVLAMTGQSEPRTWEDLAQPGYFQWVALADPAHSGSIAVTYNTILRRLGWTDGWAMLRRTYANARYFTSSAAKVPVDVSAGEAGAGMCIDFYGRFQAGAVGGDRVGYVDPPLMTAITPDPIAIVRGAPNRELAEQFIAWLLSPGAQSLWQRRLGTPGGPVRFELRRVPVRRDLYTPEETRHWADQMNPFELAKPFPPAMQDYYRIVAPVTHAMAIDIHDELKAAWEAILKNPSHPRQGEMVRAFDAMPEELTFTWSDAELTADWRAIIADPAHPRHAEAAAELKAFVDQLTGRYVGGAGQGKLLEDRLAWTRFFRANYRRVLELAEEG